MKSPPEKIITVNDKRADVWIPLLYIVLQSIDERAD